MAVLLSLQCSCYGYKTALVDSWQAQVALALVCVWCTPKIFKFELHIWCLDFALADEDGNNQWPEGLKFLFDSVSSQNMGLREAALHIFWYMNLFWYFNVINTQNILADYFSPTALYLF